MRSLSCYRVAVADPRELPDALTPITSADVARELGAAWPSIVGTAPTRKGVLSLLAIWALETGYGRSTHQYNIGNIKAWEGDGHSWTFFRCSERDANGVTTFYDPPSPQCRFRAYDSLQDGVRDFLLYMHRRFSKVWPVVEAGDPTELAHQMKLRGYYTADESKYASGLRSTYSRLSMQVPEQLLPPEPRVPWLPAASLGVALGYVAAELVMAHRKTSPGRPRRRPRRGFSLMPESA